MSIKKILIKVIMSFICYLLIIVFSTLVNRESLKKLLRENRKIGYIGTRNHKTDTFYSAEVCVKHGVASLNLAFNQSLRYLRIICSAVQWKDRLLPTSTLQYILLSCYLPKM